MHWFEDVDRTKQQCKGGARNRAFFLSRKRGELSARPQGRAGCGAESLRSSSSPLLQGKHGYPLRKEWVRRDSAVSAWALPLRPCTNAECRKPLGAREDTTERRSSSKSADSEKKPAAAAPRRAGLRQGIASKTGIHPHALRCDLHERNPENGEGRPQQAARGLSFISKESPAGDE